MDSGNPVPGSPRSGPHHKTLDTAAREVYLRAIVNGYLAPLACRMSMCGMRMTPVAEGDEGVTA
jgi:hypothetical protein